MKISEEELSKFKKGEIDLLSFYENNKKYYLGTTGYDGFNFYIVEEIKELLPDMLPLEGYFYNREEN